MVRSVGDYSLQYMYFIYLLCLNVKCTVCSRSRSNNTKEVSNVGLWELLSLLLVKQNCQLRSTDISHAEMFMAEVKI